MKKRTYAILTGLAAVALWGCGPSGPTCVSSDMPEAQAPFLDQNCDGIDGEQTSAVFVDVVSGEDQLHDGSKDHPKKSIAAALTAAQQQGKKQVLISKGVYVETVQLISGISLFGAYDASQGWSRSESNQVIIRNAPIVINPAVTDPVESITVRGVDIQDTTQLSNIRLEAVDNPAPGGHVYAVQCIRCPGLVLDHAAVVAGRGGAGGIGQHGISGMAGAGGVAGTNSSCTGSVGGAGGPGAPSSFPLAAGGAGGQGGAPGSAGQSGANAASGAPGGSGSFGGAGTNGLARTTADWGTPGTAGAGGSWQGDTWVGMPGGDGGNGKPGNGGGGGGGSSGALMFGVIVPGNGGGGGGAGGAPGAGGRGGGAGGASIGIALVNSTGAVVRSSNIVTLGGGPGGNGGNGGAGGAGGTGAFGGGNTCSGTVVPGGKGGNGSPGTPGGAGGGGEGGPSVAIFHPGTDMTNQIQGNISMQPGPGGVGGLGGSMPTAAPAGQDGSSKATRS